MPLTQFSFTTQFEKDRTTVVRLPSLSSMVDTGPVFTIVTPQSIPDRRESANVPMGPPPIPKPMPQTSHSSALDVDMNYESVSVSGPVRLVLMLPVPKILCLKVVPEVSLPQALPLPPAFPPTLRLSIQASATLHKTITFESSKEELRRIIVHVNESSRAELCSRPAVVDGAFAVLDSLQMWIWDGPTGKWNDINFGDNHVLAGKTYDLSLYHGLSDLELQTDIQHLYAALEEMQTSSEAFNADTIASVKATQQFLSQMVVHAHNLVAYVNSFKIDFSLKLESNLRQTQLQSGGSRKDISQNQNRIHLLLTHLRARSDQTSSALDSVTQAIAAIHSKEPVIPTNASGVTEETLQIPRSLLLCQEVTKVIVPHFDLSTVVMDAINSPINIPAFESITKELFIPSDTGISDTRNQRVAEVSDIIIECQQQRWKIAEDIRERNSLLQRREVDHKHAYSQIDAQAATMIESLNRKLGEVEERVHSNAESTASFAVKQLWSQTQYLLDLWSILLRRLLADSDHMQDASTRTQLAKEILEALQPQPRDVFKNPKLCPGEGANTGTFVHHPHVIFSKEAGQQVAEKGNIEPPQDCNSDSNFCYSALVMASNDISNRGLISRESPNVQSLVSSNLRSLASQRTIMPPPVIQRAVQVCQDNEVLTTYADEGALQDGGIKSSDVYDVVSEVGVIQSALVFENTGPQIREEVSHSTKEIEDENLHQKLPDVSCCLDAAVKSTYNVDPGQTSLRTFLDKRRVLRVRYLLIVFLLLGGIVLLYKVLKTTVEQWFEEVVHNHFDYRSRRMLRNLGN
ncbi:hypothetical protein C8J55DRAFT_485972 [Lentinula edodes]|uniref:Uncharacterized protein n=1 Tax=Lentinula lateritia TaxID=40482 RepID=A0A9W9AY47_9AGAR|nr:hypothetical protein C8J55DRAFT_485972 [Lentinula edodes]